MNNIQQYKWFINHKISKLQWIKDRINNDLHTSFLVEGSWDVDKKVKIFYI